MFVPRIAYCSPINPAPSGISDYSEELLPYLAQYAEITLYLEDGLRPSNPALARHLNIAPITRLERHQRRRPYDAIVYHIGNSPAHAGIWRVARRLAGVVVLHDFVLHHFMLWYAANVVHDVQAYVRAMEQRYGQAGAHMAGLMIRSRFTEAAFDFPCVDPVLAAARGLIGHSHYVIERVAALRPDLPTALVPMGVPLPPLRERVAARARLGLPPDALLLASFGHINAYKRLEPALRALAALRAERSATHYILVGSVSPNFDLAGLVARMGLSDAVTITGYVAREQFEDYVAAADICLNLRHPTGGETSASLLRLLGAGRPTLVTASGSFAELPPAVVALVDPDPSEGDQILAYCRLLAARPELAAALGNHARAYVASEHTLDRAALGYARFLARLYGWPALFRLHSAPLWPLDTPPETPAAAAKSAQQRRSQHQRSASERHTSQLDDALPSLPTSQIEQQPTPLISAAAHAAAELGLDERDEQLLRTIAARIADLGEK